jgi:hypothetical protein
MEGEMRVVGILALMYLNFAIGLYVGPTNGADMPPGVLTCVFFLTAIFTGMVWLVLR